MKQFIRNNWALILGLSLPILMVLGLFLLNYLPKLWVLPPKYNVLYVMYAYGNDNRASTVLVNNGKLEIKSGTKEKNIQNLQNPQLFLFDVQKKTSKEIIIPANAYSDNSNQTLPLILPVLENATLHTAVLAPDGYSIVEPGVSGGGMAPLFFDFSGGDRNNLFVLQKNGNTVFIPKPIDKYYSDKHFLGWIIPK